MELEINLAHPAPDYGMFSDLGNAAVHDTVIRARKHQWSWAETLRALHALAEHEPFGEALDTEVREIVYSRLGYKEAFYQ